MHSGAIEHGILAVLHSTDILSARSKVRQRRNTTILLQAYDMVYTRRTHYKSPFPESPSDSPTTPKSTISDGSSEARQSRPTLVVCPWVEETTGWPEWTFMKHKSCGLTDRTILASEAFTDISKDLLSAAQDFEPKSGCRPTVEERMRMKERWTTRVKGAVDGCAADKNLTMLVGTGDLDYWKLAQPGSGYTSVLDGKLIQRLSKCSA